jgi:hypothetical protein
MVTTFGPATFGTPISHNHTALSLSLIRQRISGLRNRCEGGEDADGISLAHFTSIFDLPTAHWSQLVQQSGNMLLSAPYLAALEQHPYKGMCFHYVIAYRSTEPVALLYFQETDVHIANVDRNVDTEKLADKSMLSRVKGLVMKGLESVRLRLLVHGNLLQSGDHAAFFHASLALDVRARLIDRSCRAVIGADRSGKKIRGLLVKDITPEMETELQKVDTELTQFEVQPNMEVQIRPHWNSFDDVLNDYSSKYRVRANAAIKKAAHLDVRMLEEADILRHNDRIMELFKNVESQSDFHMVSIHPRYFMDMKAALDDHFIMRGYFLGEELIGFYSYIRGMGHNYASFVGIDYAHNRDCAIYQNMLYRLMEDAILDKATTVDLARTAMEIKSTIGAEPVSYRLMVKHLNGMTNSVVRQFIKNIRSKEWEQRRPFKEQA